MFKRLLILFLCMYHIAGAQTSIPNTLMALQTNAYIKLDGKADEPFWQEATRISNFTQRELNFGEPASERTEVAIAYNKEYLYIAVWCYDKNPREIIARELKRDFNYDLDDNFKVVIDTYNDKRNGFMFITNPNAARADLQIFNNGGSSNIYWNGVWNVQTTLTDSGWFAEFEIPFYTLKYKTDVSKEQSWGINFERNIRHKREQVMWQGWSRNNKLQQVTYAGSLIGLNKLTDKQFVEIKPYALGGVQYDKNKGSEVGAVGGDVNYLLSPTYRLNLTFNTDFAQVESDQQQVNITRFPLFFPELREFFLEGDDYFNMGFGGNRIIPFYTRRIGLDQNREAVPIIAGARLLGKERNSTLGLMSIQTAETETEPLTNYTIGSWRQDVGKQSVFGLMSVNKFENNRWHTTTGVNGRYSTSKFLRNKNLDIGGAFIQTYNTDSGYQAKAYAYRAFIAYLNDKFTVFASTQQSPAPFNPEVGLMLRTNFRESFAEVAFKPRPKKHFKWIRQFEFIPLGITYTQYDDTRDMQSFEYKLQFVGFETRKGERFTIDSRWVAEGLISDFEITKKITIPIGTYEWQQWNAELRTFRGRRFSIISKFVYGDFYDGTSTQTRNELLWRTSKFFNISLRHEWNNVHLPEGKFYTNLIGSRIEYAVNPNVFGSFLTQWNNSQEEFNFNFRLHIIPKIGTDFFVIVNQIVSTQSNSLDFQRTTALAKLVWRFTL